MELNRVLIVVKPSSLDKSCGRCARGSAAPSFPLIKKHAAALENVMSGLEEIGVLYRVIARDTAVNPKRVDLIIPVGGDGTFLAAAHTAADVPLLGVNPDPARSVGFFCKASAATFRKILGLIISNKMRHHEVPLIETRIDGRTLPILALNDVLFAGSSPAESVAYIIKICGKRERQKSSGIWISSGPGSTAAIQSAGGRPLGIFSRKLQYLVREPCPMPDRKYRLMHGILKEKSEISIESAMRNGTIYIDGHWNAYAAPRGAKVTCRVAKQTLKLYI
jgi:NAD+ kinase